MLTWQPAVARRLLWARAGRERGRVRALACLAQVDEVQLRRLVEAADMGGCGQLAYQVRAGASPFCRAGHDSCGAAHVRTDAGLRDGGVHPQHTLHVCCAVGVDAVVVVPVALGCVPPAQSFLACLVSSEVLKSKKASLQKAFEEMDEVGTVVTAGCTALRAREPAGRPSRLASSPLTCVSWRVAPPNVFARPAGRRRASLRGGHCAHRAVADHSRGRARAHPRGPGQGQGAAQARLPFL